MQGGSNSSAGLSSTPATLLASVAAASSNSTARTPAITFHRPWSLADELFLLDGVNAGRSFEALSSQMPGGARTGESCRTYWQHAMIGAGKVTQRKQQDGIGNGDGAAAAAAPRWVRIPEPRTPIFNSSRSATPASARQNKPPAAVAAAASSSKLAAADVLLTPASSCNAAAAPAAAAARRGKPRRWSFADETFLLDGANSGRSFVDLARNLPGGPRTADSCRQHWHRAMIGKGKVVHAADTAAAAGAELEEKAKPTWRRSVKYAREVAAGLDSGSDGDDEEEEDGPSPAAAAAAAAGPPHQPRTLASHTQSSNAAATAAAASSRMSSERSEEQKQTGGEEKQGRSEQREVAASSPLSSPALSPSLAAAVDSSTTLAASPALPPLHWRVQYENYPGFTVHTHTASLTEVRRLFNARIQLEMREPREEIRPPPMTQAWLLRRKGEWKAVDKPSIALLFADPTFLAERRAAAAAAGFDGMCMTLRFEVGNRPPEDDGTEQERQQDQEIADISQLGKARRSRKPAAAIASSTTAAVAASSAAASGIIQPIAKRVDGALSVAEPRTHRGRWPKYKPSFARARFAPIATPLLDAWAADYPEFRESGIAETDREGIIDWLIDNIQHKTKLPTLQSAIDFFKLDHPHLPVPKREDDPDVKAATLQPSAPSYSDLEMQSPSPPPLQSSSKSVCSGCHRSASALSAAGFCYDCSLPSEEDSDSQSQSSASSAASFDVPVSSLRGNRQQKNCWTEEEDDTLLSCLNQGLRASIQKRLAKLGRPYSRTQASAITHFYKLKAAGLVRSRPATEEERAAGMMDTVWEKVAPQKKGEETASTGDYGEKRQEEAAVEQQIKLEPTTDEVEENGAPMAADSSELGDSFDVLAAAAVAEAAHLGVHSPTLQAESEDGVRPSKKFKPTDWKRGAESRQQQQESFVAARAAQLVDIASVIRDSLPQRNSSDDPHEASSDDETLDEIAASAERFAAATLQFAADLKKISQSRRQRKSKKRARATTPVEATPLAIPVQDPDFSMTPPSSPQAAHGGPVAMEVDGAAATPAVAAASPLSSPTLAVSTAPPKRAPSPVIFTSPAVPSSGASERADEQQQHPPPSPSNLHAAASAAERVLEPQMFVFPCGHIPAPFTSAGFEAIAKAPAASSQTATPVAWAQESTLRDGVTCSVCDQSCRSLVVGSALAAPRKGSAAVALEGASP